MTEMNNKKPRLCLTEKLHICFLVSKHQDLGRNPDGSTASEGLILIVVVGTT